MFLIPGALAGFTHAVAGIVSNQVPPNRQGELQGALASVASVTSIVGPLFMTQTFAWFTGPSAPVYYPGAPFMVALVLTVGAWAVFAGVTRQLGSGFGYGAPTEET